MEEVILVDHNDQEIGVMEKMEAHRLGLLHRAFSVILFNNHNEILLQQRAFSKYHSPGLWTNTCCSHPRPGESTDAGAVRRLEEEMGIQCALKSVFNFKYWVDLENGLYEHEVDHVYLGQFSGEPEINRDEVAAWKYMDFNTIRLDVAANPDDYTFWFRILVQKISIMGINQILLS
jgi:isopentenyl-diphosphate delta-isomerase